MIDKVICDYCNGTKYENDFPCNVCNGYGIVNRMQSNNEDCIELMFANESVFIIKNGVYFSCNANKSEIYIVPSQVKVTVVCRECCVHIDGANCNDQLYIGHCNTDITIKRFEDEIWFSVKVKNVK